MTTTRICFVRHGESVWNAERRVQGQLDIPLSVTGIKQAEAVANSVAREKFDALYASDLIRARDTAEAVARQLRLPVQSHQDLRERHFGIFQGLTYDDVQAR